MSASDVNNAFDAIVGREWGSHRTAKLIGEQELADAVAQRNRQHCGGFRELSFFDDVQRTQQLLIDKKYWKNRALVFSDTIDGESIRLCPLVEYHPRRSASFMKLVRYQTEYFMTEDGRIALIDERGLYDIPQASYWRRDYKLRSAVMLRLRQVYQQY